MLQKLTGKATAGADKATAATVGIASVNSAVEGVTAATFQHSTLLLSINYYVFVQQR